MYTELFELLHNLIQASSALSSVCGYLLKVWTSLTVGTLNWLNLVSRASPYPPRYGYYACSGLGVVRETRLN